MARSTNEINARASSKSRSQIGGGINNIAIIINVIALIILIQRDVRER